MWLKRFWKFHVVAVQTPKEMYKKVCCTCKVVFFANWIYFVSVFVAVAAHYTILYFVWVNYQHINESFAFCPGLNYILVSGDRSVTAYKIDDWGRVSIKSTLLLSYVVLNFKIIIIIIIIVVSLLLSFGLFIIIVNDKIITILNMRFAYRQAGKNR